MTFGLGSAWPLPPSEDQSGAIRLEDHMTLHFLVETLHPVDALDALVARHGAWRVALALPRALLQRRRAQVLRDRHISAHILRDIGLPPDPLPRDPWEYR
jgi:hypothetical protein